MSGPTRLNREELQYGNRECRYGHPMWFVAEGYGRCVNESRRTPHYAWRISEPLAYGLWCPEGDMWGSASRFSTIDELLDFIQDDMDATREAMRNGAEVTHLELEPAI